MPDTVLCRSGIRVRIRLSAGVPKWSSLSCRIEKLTSGGEEELSGRAEDGISGRVGGGCWGRRERDRTARGRANKGRVSEERKQGRREKLGTKEQDRRARRAGETITPFLTFLALPVRRGSGQDRESKSETDEVEEGRALSFPSLSKNQSLTLFFAPRPGTPGTTTW
ncbi:hypothetical protein BDK51DRAFT_31758 [Blyttiomyces helicus]|uniref:Uncharacterized protein n=1 Tax=Blyttiomyces helicus TaxID=388810 RepID=A0A4P9WLU7_9FUNG|nr:hypothetical protein BDK51DRAFT_31758 [Blyttiomyces helicus]|eukprot:RKO93063.1 hypothetical protein BDK51DRAFT_31758 [Blyttiomyces helicus]